MSIRYVKIPEDIMFKDLSGEVSKDEKGLPMKLSFKDYMTRHVLNDHRWNADIKSIRASISVENALKASEDTGTMQIGGDDFEKLKPIIESPQYTVPTVQGPQPVPGIAGYNAIGVRQMMPFFDAILEASDKPMAIVKDQDEAKKQD